MALTKGTYIPSFLDIKVSRRGFFLVSSFSSIFSDTYDKEKTEIQYDLALLASYKKPVEKKKRTKSSSEVLILCLNSK